MKKQFVTREIAKKLKKLGFSEDCLAYHENNTYPKYPEKYFVVPGGNHPLTKEQQKRPGLYKLGSKNSELPQWATSAPLWQQVKEWLWNKHKFWIQCFSSSYSNSKYSVLILQAKQYNDSPKSCKKNLYNSPLLAEIEGVKLAVRYLYSKKKKKKREI